MGDRAIYRSRAASSDKLRELVARREAAEKRLKEVVYHLHPGYHIDAGLTRVHLCKQVTAYKEKLQAKQATLYREALSEYETKKEALKQVQAEAKARMVAEAANMRIEPTTTQAGPVTGKEFVPLPSLKNRKAAIITRTDNEPEK